MKKFFYRVEQNECVASVAYKFDVSVVKIIKDNNLCREIEEGDVLYVQKEDCAYYKVKPSDTLHSLANKFNTTEQKILQDNGIDYIFYGLTIKV